MTNQLFGVLTRFREKPVAAMADIEAMFHQVKVTRNTVMLCASCGGRTATWSRNQRYTE